MQTSELEKTFASLGEKLQRRCICPSCHVDNVEFFRQVMGLKRGNKKDYAPNHAAFYPFGADVFLSQRKIDRIVHFVELPVINSTGKVPPILVVNLQIPLYPASIFQNEYDGEGMSFVFYFKLKESYVQEIPLHFQENIRKLIEDGVERVRGFPVDTIAPFREGLKILGRVVNMEDLHLSAAERKLMNSYNENPVLSRPQHEFYLGENYFEIDLDMHRFSFIPKKGFGSISRQIEALCPGIRPDNLGKRGRGLT